MMLAMTRLDFCLKIGRCPYKLSHPARAMSTHLQEYFRFHQLSIFFWQDLIKSWPEHKSLHSYFFQIKFFFLLAETTSQVFARTKFLIPIGSNWVRFTRDSLVVVFRELPYLSLLLISYQNQIENREKRVIFAQSHSSCTDLTQGFLILAVKWER